MSYDVGETTESLENEHVASFTIEVGLYPMIAINNENV